MTTNVQMIRKCASVIQTQFIILSVRLGLNGLYSNKLLMFFLFYVAEIILILTYIMDIWIKFADLAFVFIFVSLLRDRTSMFRS